MKRSVNLIAVLGAVLLCGCVSTEPEKPIGSSYFSTNYIQYYVMPDGIELAVGTYNSDAITLSFKGRTYSNIIKEDTEKYNELALYWSDTGYSGYFTSGFENGAVAYPITSVSVVSNKQYNEAHPVGSSLDDVVQWSFPSAYPYIKSGYTEYGRYVHIDKLLCDLTTEDMTLVRPDAMFSTLHFINAPVGETHTFTVAVEYCGNRFTKSLDITF